MQTQAEFFQANAVDGVLTDAQTAQMLGLPEGEIELVSEDTDSKTGGEPSATPAPTPAPAPPAAPAVPEPKVGEDDPAIPDDKKVIAAKDGVHTIGYEKLVQAREAEKAAKAEADGLREQLAKATAPTPAPAPGNASVPAAPAPSTEQVDFGDYSDEALRKGIEKTVKLRVAAELDQAVTEKLTPLLKQQRELAVKSHFEPIYKAHPNMDSMLESTEFKSWIEGKPRFEQAAINAVLEQGTSQDVIEVFDSFTKAAGKAQPPTSSPSPSPAPAAVDPKEAARQAVASAAGKPPTSLSEVPGSVVQHDEANALAELSPAALMTRFADKTPEQIEALMKKTL